MRILARIDGDFKSAKRHFEELFKLLERARKEDKEAPVELLDIYSTESLKSYHSFSHLIKPNMVIDIYSLTEYWFVELCKKHKNIKNLTLSHTDIKGKNDLHVFKKYLTLCVGLELRSLENTYNHLNNLRKVRKYLIHNGGHVPDGIEQELSAIDGIRLSGSLICIHNSFVWESLDNAKKYLSAVAKQLD